MKNHIIRAIITPILIFTLVLGNAHSVWGEPGQGEPEVEENANDASEEKEEPEKDDSKEGVEKSNDHRAVSIRVESIDFLPDEGKFSVTAAFYDSKGETPNDIKNNYIVTIFVSPDTKSRNTITDENNSITKKFGISEKEYDVYAVLYDAGENKISESEHTTIYGHTPSITNVNVTASADDEANGIIEVAEASRLAYRPYGQSTDLVAVEGNKITGLPAGKYSVYLPAYAEGNHYYKGSNSKTVVVPGGGEGSKTYTVAKSGDEKVTFGNTATAVKEGSDLSVYVKPADSDHYIDSVAVEPESGYDSFSYSRSTGELFIRNIKGNIMIKALAKEIAVVSSLSVKNLSFKRSGIFSGDTPAVITTFEVSAKDSEGKPVTGAKLYFSEDIKNRSFTQTGKTDENGIATFVHTYSFSTQNGTTQNDFTPVFGADQSFTNVKATTDIHLVLQRKKDLVLYDDQIIATLPGENSGKVINVPEGYEIWTGEVHQGALVVGSGKWVPAENGVITGLSSGQHAIRAGDRVSDDGHTFWLASDYDYFEVPRGEWHVSLAGSDTEGIILTGDAELIAGPGGTVYFYLKPSEGFVIDSYTVDKPSNVSGEIRYNEENGYIVIEGITGSLILTVTAKRIPAESAGSKIGDDDNVSDGDNVKSGASTPTVSGRYYPAAVIPVTVQLPEAFSGNAITPSRGVLFARTPIKEIKLGDTDNKTTTKTVSRSSVKPVIPLKKIDNDPVPLAQSIPVEDATDDNGFIWILLVLVLVAASLTVTGAAFRNRFGK